MLNVLLLHWTHPHHSTNTYQHTPKQTERTELLTHSVAVARSPHINGHIITIMIIVLFCESVCHCDEGWTVVAAAVTEQKRQNRKMSFFQSTSEYQPTFLCDFSIDQWIEKHAGYTDAHIQPIVIQRVIFCFFFCVFLLYSVVHLSSNLLRIQRNNTRGREKKWQQWERLC